MEIVEQKVEGYERVVIGRDAAAGYHGIVAVHSTVLGAAVGGTRLWHYDSEAEALRDVLRLSRGMTYKSALAGLAMGGGKSVLLRPPHIADRAAMFHAHGRLIESLGGSYITAEDVGTSPSDMELIRHETKHVAGLEGRSGDPSPVTARGVFRAMQAAARHQWGSDELSGKKVAIQGCGHVGYPLARELAGAGAKLFVADIDEQRVASAVKEFGATAVALDDIVAADVDIFAPCALGGVLNDVNIPRIKAAMVVGAANNQLLEERHGEMLAQRGILYVPDYAANAGGIINGCREVLGWDTARTAAKVEQIYDTVRGLLELSAREGILPHRAADLTVERRLSGAARA